MRNVLGVIMGGGQGSRLRPLTAQRAKPAVPFAGKYRLVDIPISNCLHAGIDRIFVLTQFRSASLNRHVGQTYRFDAFSDGHVTVLAAELTEYGDAASNWYQGTADAVRKHLRYFAENPDDDVVILSGDQVYAMQLDEMLRVHREAGAEVTIATTRVAREPAKRLGLMKVDSCNWIEAFAEKPTDDAVLDAFAAPRPEEDKSHLASMGIYIFRARTLQKLLTEDDRNDFGKHIIPRAIEQHPVLAYPFDGYWEDVGTIESYHRVHLELAAPEPRFDLFDASSHIYTRPRFLPPAKIGRATLHRALLCDGCVLDDGAVVRDSVVGIRGRVGADVTLERVVVNGAGAYDFDGREHGGVPLGVGEGSYLRNVILDRDVRVGRGVRIVNERGLEHYEDGVITVRNGIAVVARRGVVPDGYVF